MNHKASQRLPAGTLKPAILAGKRQVAAYMTPEEVQAVEKMALIFGVSVSSLLRQALVRWLREIAAEARTKGA